ncbi:MAG: PorV/PorQ family protein [Ignavibacteriaceae bacterium]|nr:PorV/PorQ family protein [Ignavibacteriaceae bacterium]
MKKIILILILIATSIYAGDVARKGTTGAEQVLIPVGARGIATGGAFLANITGLESIFYNPAGLDVYPQTEAMFSYVNYLADINISYFAIGTSLGDIGSIGLDLKTFDFGDIPVTTETFPDGTGETYSPSFLTIGFTYSKVLTDRISIGTNLKIISENIQNTNATGFALDAGVQYRFSEALMIGAAVKNIGSDMSYSGQDLSSRTVIPGSIPGSSSGSYEIITEGFQIPSFFQLSMTYALNINEQNNLMFAGAYTANNSFEDIANLGMEYGFMNNFFVRGGYNFLVQNTSEYVYGLTFGAGLDYKLGGEVGFVFDYAFRDVKDFPTANHVFTIKLSFQ